MEVSIRTRGRSRSVALTDRDRVVNDENSVKATAPNLNGDECGDVEKIKENIESENNGEDNVEEDKVDASENDGSIDKPGKGKKRKASELKSEDENANEESISKKVELADPIPSTDQDSKGELKADESSASEVDLENPQKQTLGKGKRARIPNKRYSEILSPNRRKSIENGSERIESENDVAADTPVKEETLNATVTSLKSVINAASPSNPYKKQRISVDLSDPKYLKPFKLGWKRELVWRAVNDSSTKRNGDIYYYTPLGKKVRSMREVAENLTNKKLSIENFTFFKESLGIDDPEKEIIRNAKKPAGVSLSKKTPIKAEPTKAEPTKAEPIKAQQIKPSPAKVIQPKPVQAAKVVKTPKSPKLPPTPKISSPKISSPRVDGNQTADSPAIKSKATAKSLGNFKIKLPPKKDKKSLKAEEKMETEVETTPVRAAVNRKSGKWTRSSSTSPVKAKKRTIKLSSITNSEEKEGNKFMENYLQNLSYGYNTLLYVFQYLKVQDLLRAGCVCTMWRDIASHPMLWRTVRMKNSQVHSFEGLANTLKKHGTRHLDLRKMLLPTGGDEIWPEFSKAIERVDTLSRIELCRCPATVVGKLAITNPRLEVINAVTIKCESMDLEPLKTLTNIKELRLKSTGGLTISSDIDSLKDMIFLRHLALTSIRDLDSMNLSVIGELVNLESLDLGECTDFPKTFGSDILVKLEKLEKLRLEKGQGNCHTFEILEAVKDMPHLEQLELVNFDIKAGFDKALGVCQNIKKMLIIPTYISQSATTNHMVLGGVLRLQRTLSHFVWGVTLELLRVTELFVDQCEEPKKEKKQVGNGDSIPVLKPIPLLMDNENEIPPAHDPPQVEILALPSLQKLLMQNLPTTRVKILKIPFHATWRQSITDSVN